jgi:hypothetical protein
MSLRSSPIIIRISEEDIENDYTLSIPFKIYNSLNKYSVIRLKLGVLMLDVTCFLNNTENHMIVSKNIASKLSLHSDLNTNLLIKENVLCLGPLIGTFTDSTSVRIASEQRPGNKLLNLSLANKDAGTIIYFFSVDDYNNEDEKILGTFYNYISQRFEKRLFPLPDILYDRGGGILKNQKTASDYIRQSIESNETVKRFNPRYFFDKLDVHNKLIRYKEFSQYLPETIPYKNSNDLITMFDKSPILYIKDRIGNRGLGVTRVRKYPNGNFELSYFKKEFYKYGFDSFDQLVKKLNELYENKKAIIQCSIDVFTINNGNVDMRATVQRDGNGTLGITACPVRIGCPGVPITSTRSGSSVLRFEDFFRKFYNYSEAEINTITARTSEFLLATYKYIEDLYGTFGEIGIDFAIDNNKNIWFIECNAKPGKDTVYLSYDEVTVKKAFQNPLEYSKYLCDF